MTNKGFKGRSASSPLATASFATLVVGREEWLFTEATGPDTDDLISTSPSTFVPPAVTFISLTLAVVAAVEELCFASATVDTTEMSSSFASSPPSTSSASRVAPPPSLSPSFAISSCSALSSLGSSPVSSGCLVAEEERFDCASFFVRSLNSCSNAPTVCQIDTFRSVGQFSTPVG